MALPSPRARVTLHWCRLDLPREETDRLATLLSPGERARMERFGSPLLRDRYTVGRASLRLLLASRAGMAPDRIAIGCDAMQRPHLRSSAGIDFNVSHTGGTAVFAIAENARVGVDIEPEQRQIRTSDILRKFMSANERAPFASLDVDQARARVLRLWTCKEALSKATGDALAAPFSRLTVALEPMPRLIAGPAPYCPRDFALFALEAPPGFVASLAIWERPDSPVSV